MNPTLRTARKEYQCIHCYRRIPRNHRYVYERITPWDHPDNDGFFTYRAHPRCNTFWRDHAGEYSGFTLVPAVIDPPDFRIACWRHHVHTIRHAHNRTPTTA